MNKERNSQRHEVEAKSKTMTAGVINLIREFEEGKIFESQYEKLTKLAQQGKIEKFASPFDEALISLRMYIKYHVFDLEVTRRENKYLRKLLKDNEYLKKLLKARGKQ